jgi:molybdate transport system substrate-binding protein
MIRISLALSCLLFVAPAQMASAAEIKVLAGSAIETAMAELIPQFEKASGHRVVHDFNGAIGAMTERVRKGEAADVVIVSRPQIDMLEKAGRVVAGSTADIAKVGIGVFVRKGAARPDIGTVEAFKRTMLAAKSIGWNDPAAGAPVSLYLISLFERLGIADAMTPKTVAFKVRSERFAAVARGDVELGFNQISEIVAASGVELVGPLPAEIQKHTLFTAGVVAESQVHDAARALVRFITADDARVTWKTKGFEPPR